MNFRRHIGSGAVVVALVALLVGAGAAQASVIKDGGLVAKPKMSQALKAELKARVARVQKQRAQVQTRAEREAAAVRLAAMKTKVQKRQVQRMLRDGVPLALVRQALAAGPLAGTTPQPGGVPDYLGYSNWANSPILRKFVDTLPGLGSGAANNLGNYIPVAAPDTVTYPGSDYYELSVRRFTQKFHSDLPATHLRGYVQTNMGTDASGRNTIAPAPIMYLGPQIIA